MFNRQPKKITVFALIFLFVFGLISPALALKPDDPDYFLEWQIEKMSLPLAWDYTTGSPAVVVAVLDTGVDVKHPDLADNIWVNTGEIPGDGIDNDGNGYIDDVNGYDFVDEDANPAPDFSKGYNPLALSHGTMVAGLIGGVGNNLRGLAGVAWQAKIMPLRILDNWGMASVPPTLAAVQYAIDNGAEVINLSFQGEFPLLEFQQILEKAYRAGVVIVAAAGNGNHGVNGFDLDQTEFYPVCYQTADGQNMIIGVGATNQADERSDFSNYGKCVDIMAPGEEIYSTEAYRGPNTDLETYYGGDWRGTSSAAPLVSGVAALIKSINQNFSPDQILNFITTTADPLGYDYSSTRYAGKLGAGRVNAGAAVKAAAEYSRGHAEELAWQAAGWPRAYVTPGLVVAPIGAGAPEVRVLTNLGVVKNKFLAYETDWRGGVNLALGDFNQDGKKEIVTAPGAGHEPAVRIFSQTGTPLTEFLAYDATYRGGVKVAVKDIDADGQAEIVTAPQTAGKEAVKIFTQKGEVKYQIKINSKNFVGGVNLALGDLDLDGKAEIVLSSAKGGAGAVQIWTYQGKLMRQFSVADKKFTGGLSLAVGDIDGDSRPEIITAPESGAEPRVKIFNQEGKLKKDFLVGEKAYLGGLTLATGDYNGDGWLDLAASQASGDPVVNLVNGLGQIEANFSVFSQGYTGGVNVAIID
ncbi:MAG: S8 family serine peptidase [Patescibacteria group bacterium]|jgi:subtilisin family serine protease